MNVTLDKVFIKRFFSVKEAELAFSNNGLTLIRGEVQDSSFSESNGAGKSTIIEAILWCLYENTLRGVTKDQVVNRFYNKDCEVKLTGKVGEVPFEVTRYRKHTTNKNNVIFMYNGVEVTAASDKLTNEKIVKTFGIDFESFQTNIVFSSNSLKFLEFGDADRKRFFDSIIKSDLYERAAEKTREKLRLIENELSAINLEVNFKNATQESLLKDLSSYEEKIQKFNKDKQDALQLIQANINSLTEAISQLGDFSKLTQLKEELSKEIESLISNQSAVSNQYVEPLRGLGKEISACEAKVKLADKDLQNTHKEHTILLGQIETADEDVQKFEKAISAGVCPTCSKPLENNTLVEIVADKKKLCQDLTNKLESLNKVLEERRIEFNTLKAQFDLKSTELKPLQELSDKEEALLSTKRLAVQQQIQEKKNEIVKIDEASTKFLTITLQLKSEQQKFETKQAEVNVYEELKQNCFKTLGSLKVELSTLADKLNIVESRQARVKYWVNGFKAVKGLLISTVTPMMNEKAKQYSESLTNGEISFNFVTQRENKDGSFKEVFDIEVERATGASDYKGMSAGEKRRIDLITMFVLDDLRRSNNMVEFNIRFYDEVFDSLDSLGVTRLMDLMRGLAQNTGIYVISHRTDLKDLFAKSLTVVNRNGNSEIVNG